MAARLRKGDTVVVISGKHKGRTGTISAIMAESDKVIVEGINLVSRHMKPSPRNQQGGIVSKEMPLHASKVMPVDAKTGKGTRVRFTTDDKGVKTRVAVKSGEAIATPKYNKTQKASASA
jgi:large subunit ribosomal protein L24